MTLAVATLLALGLPAAAAEKGGLDQTGPYEAVAGWFKPGVDRWAQPPTSILIDTPNRIIVTTADQKRAAPISPILTAAGKVLPEKSDLSKLNRDMLPHLHQILVLNAEGEVVEDWAQWNDLFEMPHSAFISPYDAERHIWIVDLGHQIVKLTNDGKKVVMKLGEKGGPGWDKTHFNMPSSLAFLPDGSFLVADGYVNGRVAKFDKDGKYISEFGSKGSGPGQFDLVHSLAIDAKGRIYAADRRNHRIQVFDASGKFVEEWKNVGSPTRLFVSQDQYLWMSDADYERMAKFDLDGQLVTYWGAIGGNPGEVDNLHNFDVDKDGNLFVVDGNNNRAQKLVPKRNGDPKRMVGQQYFLPANSK
ncbi:MAG: 6-bladed beta-propeller [Rhodospirillaceae bacterium]|nr:6-bladed beta-propeller [Rhodospirillaceae bacterium]